MTAADIALIVVPVGFGAILLTVAVLLVIAVRNYKPGEVVCNLDCRDLHRFGLTAPDCPMPHGPRILLTEE